MQRVVIGIVALAALGLLWMVTSPASAPPAPPAASEGPASSAPTASGAAQAQAQAEGRPAQGAAPAQARDSAAERAPASQVGASPQPGTSVGPGAPTGEQRWGRAPNQGIAQISGATLKGTVRRFFGNLPKSGQVPGRVEVQEVLPPELLRDLNVPPESELLWLGERPISDMKAFEAVLAMPDDVRRMLGVTVRTPDGKEIRDYVELRP